MMRITEIHIHPVTPQGGLVAFAHVVIDDSLLLGSIGIHERRGGGLRITYPQKGSNYVFHPVNQPLSKALEAAILDKAETVLGNEHAGQRRHRAEGS